MSELAYDISYLLDSEAAMAEAPVRPVARASTLALRSPPPLVTAEETLLRDLLEVAPLHEDWIKQYLRTFGTADAGV